MSSYYVDYGSKSVQIGKSSDCYGYAMLRALRVIPIQSAQPNSINKTECCPQIRNMASLCTNKFWKCDWVIIIFFQQGFDCGNKQ